MMTQTRSDYPATSPTMTIWPGAELLPTTASSAIDAHHQRLHMDDCLNGRYELRAILGSGGMGQVFEAYDRYSARMVAIKTAWTEKDERDLEQEARALQALDGRGVPRVHGVHSSERGVRYYVMERIYGLTLASYLVERVWEQPLPVSDARDILMGIAEVLSDVHTAGLIHCDLKPANIMLAADDRIVLLDLGLSLNRGQSENRPGPALFRGSPYYLAPERITSSVVADSAHSVDIYALGVIGFLLLTGQHPFDGTSLKALLEQQVHTPAPSLSLLRGDAPWHLGFLVSEMLSKDPKHRPSSAAEIAARLRQIFV